MIKAEKTENTKRKRYSRKEYADILVAKIEKEIANGKTPYDAIDTLTEKQCDFLDDFGINLDKYLLSAEQLENVKNSNRKISSRKLFDNGYKKTYKDYRINLFLNIAEHIKSIGGTIIPREKENFRHLDFFLNDKHFQIILSEPRE